MESTKTVIKDMKKNLEFFLKQQQKSLNQGERICYKIDKKKIIINNRFRDGRIEVDYAFSANEILYTWLDYSDMLPKEWETKLKHQFIDAMQQYKSMLSSKNFCDENLTYRCYVYSDKTSVES